MSFNLPIGDRTLNPKNIYLKVDSRIFLTLLLALSSFPYVLPVTNSDLQPWAAAIAVFITIIFLLKEAVLKKCRFAKSDLFVIALALVPLIHFATLSILVARIDEKALFAYTLLPVFACLGSQMNRFSIQKTIIASQIVWGAVGLAQTLIDRRMFSTFVYRMHSSNDRGVTSFAVEPGAYANTVLLLAALYFYCAPPNLKFGKRDRFFAALVLFQLVFLAQSFSSVLAGILLVAACGWVLATWIPIRMAFIASFVLILFNVVDVPIVGRFGSLLRMMMTDFDGLLFRDPSGMERTASIFYPWKVFFAEFPLAYGHVLDGDTLRAMRDLYWKESLFGPYFYSAMSGWGAVLMQGGVGGLMWIGTIFICCLLQARWWQKFIACGFFVLMWTSVTWATPLAAIFLGKIVGSFGRRLRSPALFYDQKTQGRAVGLKHGLA